MPKDISSAAADQKKKLAPLYEKAIKQLEKGKGLLTAKEYKDAMNHLKRGRDYGFPNNLQDVLKMLEKKKMNSKMRGQ